MVLAKQMSLMDALGGGATEIVVPQKETSFVRSVMNFITDLVAPRQMSPGMSVLDATGNGGEVMTRQNSGFATAILGALAIGGLLKMVDMLSSPPPTQDQLKASALQQEQKMAAIAKEDARIATEIANNARMNAPKM